MSFVEAKKTPYSAKTDLLRIRPRRYLNDRLTGLGSGVYSTPYFAPVVGVSLNGVALTLTTGALTVGKYKVDGDSVLIYPSAAPSASNILVLTYDIYLTNGIAKILPTPPTGSGSLVSWEPLLLGPLSSSAGLEDILAGVLSVSVSMVELIHDEYLNTFLTDDDSYSLAQADAWMAIGDEINPVYQGRVSGLSVSDNKVVLEIDDAFSNLLRPALMNQGEKAYINNVDFPLSNPKDTGAPIPLVMQKLTSFDRQYIGSFGYKVVPSDRLLEAKNIDYTGSQLSSVNREWAAYKGFDSNGPTIITIRLVSSTTIVGVSANIYTRVNLNGVTTARPGDTVEIFGASPKYYEIVAVQGSGQILYFEGDITADVPVGAQVQNLSFIHYVVWRSEEHGDKVLYYPRDYSTSIEYDAVSSTHLITIVLVNNFENNFGLDPLQPGKDKILFRASTVESGTHNHSDIIKYLLQRAGLTTNTTTFNTAKTQLPVNVSFTLPAIEDNTFQSYAVYLQKILASTFGYLTLNENGEVEYHLFDTPSGTIEINETNLLKDSFLKKVEYLDLVTKIVSFNRHDDNANANVTLENQKAKYFHQVENILNFEHYLEDITQTLSKILSYRGEAKSTYTVKTKVDNLDSIVGDEVTINKDKVLGDNNTKELKILSIDKNTTSTKLNLTDLRGI